MTSISIECQTCGALVSDDFARVFGNNDDEVHACPECSRVNGTSERRVADASDRRVKYTADWSTQAQEVESDD